MKVALAAALAASVAAPAWGQTLAPVEWRVAAQTLDRVGDGLAPRPDMGDDYAEQVLSRTLRERGAQLLPEWGMAVTPEPSRPQSRSGPVLSGGVSPVAPRLSDDTQQGAMASRLGLPWDSQVELRVPYARPHDAADASGLPRRAYQLGDLEIALSHQILHEHGWQPDLLAAISGRLPTGGEADPTGANPYAVKGRLTAVTRQDAAVLFGTTTYTAAPSSDKPIGRVRPGDIVGLEVGAVFAAAPGTALTLSLAQDFTAATTVDGVAVPGSDKLSSSLHFGVNTALGPDAMLDLSVGVGLVGRTPDYQVMMSLPIRF